MPKANSEFWRMKIERNRERDADTTAQLEKADWKVIRVWEHEKSEGVSEKIYDTRHEKEIAPKIRMWGSASQMALSRMNMQTIKQING